MYNVSENLLIRRGVAGAIDVFSSFIVAYVSFHISWKELLPQGDLLFLTGVIHFCMTTLFYLINKASSMGQRFLAIEVAKKDRDKASFLVLCLRNGAFCVLFFGLFYDVIMGVLFFLVLSRVFVKESETFLDSLFSTKIIFSNR